VIVSHRDSAHPSRAKPVSYATLELPLSSFTVARRLQLSPIRRLWAVDYPYQSTEEAVAFMDAAPLSHEDKAKVYGRNAERIFRLAVR